MTNGSAGPRGHGSEDRQAAQEARRQWAAEVTQALHEQRLSINAAAKQIGISPGRLQAWLNQDVEPSPRVMPTLAGVIGRSHVHLLRLLDWLPAEMADAPLRLEASARLNEAVADAQRWLWAADRESGWQGGAQLVAALLNATDEWQATVRTSIRGRRHPVRYATHVAFAPTDPTTPTGPSAAPDGDGFRHTASDRQRIEQLLPDIMLRSGARWLAPHDWAARPDLVVEVPSLCASRPRGLRPDLTVPSSMVVVGVPQTGSREVAALIADLLDWAYLDAHAVAAEQFGPGSPAAPEVLTRAQVVTAGRVLADPGAAARHTVWSFGQPEPILQTFRSIGPELPLVILLRAPDSLLSCLPGVPGAIDDLDSDKVETAQNVARRTLEAARDPATYLILDLPDLPWEGSGSEQVDAMVDAYVGLAFRVAEWLHDHHGAPSLSSAPGILGQLWRAAGE